MLLVVFGAGASYDSSPDNPPDDRTLAERPPLANNLFVDHPLYRQFRDRFPQFLGIIGELLPRAAGWSVEEALQRLDDEADKNAKRKEQLAAIRFYLQGLISFLADRWLNTIGLGATNYDALIDQIEHHRKGPEPVCLVTFNYDTLIESALEKYYGTKLNVTADYVSHKPFRLFKLHGSTNWGHTIASAPPAVGDGGPDAMIKHAAKITLHDGIIASASYGGGLPLYPAIAIPVAKKSAFECPEDHLQMLRALLPKVTKILTIGWRGTEDHFLEMLRTVGGGSGTQVVTVAGSEAEAGETLERFRALSLGIVHHGRHAGFSATLGDRRLSAFLST